jgi:hypothetical protein
MVVPVLGPLSVAGAAPEAHSVRDRTGPPHDQCRDLYRAAGRTVSQRLRVMHMTPSEGEILWGTERHTTDG